jgi:hypothetical protein
MDSRCNKRGAERGGEGASADAAHGPSISKINYPTAVCLCNKLSKTGCREIPELMQGIRRGGSSITRFLEQSDVLMLHVGSFTMTREEGG